MKPLLKRLTRHPALVRFSSWRRWVNEQHQWHWAHTLILKQVSDSMIVPGISGLTAVWQDFPESGQAFEDQENAVALASKSYGVHYFSGGLLKICAASVYVRRVEWQRAFPRARKTLVHIAARFPVGFLVGASETDEEAYSAMLTMKPGTPLHGTKCRYGRPPTEDDEYLWHPLHQPWYDEVYFMLQPHDSVQTCFRRMCINLRFK